MSTINIDPTRLGPAGPARALKRPYVPGSASSGTPVGLTWPENGARPSWVRRAVSSAGNAPTAIWAGAEALVLSEPHLQPLRGTIKGHAIAGGYWGLALAVSTAIVL